MKRFTIQQLCGYAWECAITSVAEIIGMDKLDALTDKQFEVETICAKLHVRFDCNGNIIK